MNRVLLLCFLPLTAALFKNSASVPGPAAQQPNIVFVLADDYGYNDIGYHGDQIKTPVMDALAASGVTLENYYVQPICTPTRSQLLSGRYQIHTGLQHNIIKNEQPSGLPLEHPTIADKLKEEGYSTHMVGKWHLGFFKEEYMPHRRGFDTFYGLLGGEATYETHTFNNYLDWRDETGPIFNESGLYSTHLFTDRAIRVISDHKSRKHPLFLYLAYQSPHSPLSVPQVYEDQYRHIQDDNRRVYAGMVSAMDEGVRNLTDALKENGLWNNTVFIFSSDNGGTMSHGGYNYPLRGAKGSHFEGGVRAVGFVAGGLLDSAPDVAGMVNRELIHVSDWFPTLIKLGGGPLEGLEGLDGFDQWDTISKGEKSPREVMLLNIDTLDEPQGEPVAEYAHIWDTRVRAALRMGDYKIITGYPGQGDWKPPPDGRLYYKPEFQEDPDKNLWLFNLENDPYEYNDLSGRRPDLVKKMLHLLSQMNETAVPPWYPPLDPQADPSLHGDVWGPWL